MPLTIQWAGQRATGTLYLGGQYCGSKRGPRHLMSSAKWSLHRSKRHDVNQKVMFILPPIVLLSGGALIGILYADTPRDTFQGNVYFGASYGMAIAIAMFLCEIYLFRTKHEIEFEKKARQCLVGISIALAWIVFQGIRVETSLPKNLQLPQASFGCSADVDYCAYRAVVCCPA